MNKYKNEGIIKHMPYVDSLVRKTSEELLKDIMSPKRATEK